MKEKKDTSLVDGIALISLRLFSEGDEKLYTLIAYGENDFPPVVNGKIVFFLSAKQVEKGFAFFPVDIIKNQKVPKKSSLVCDIPLAIKIIKSGKVDNKATILNCINTFLDLLKAINEVVLEKYKKDLFAFADYLTFNKNIENYFNSFEVNRIEILQAFLWCYGRILSNCKIIS
jgi:hypothetical protein